MFRPNQEYTVRKVDSQLVCILKNSAWIPDTSGVFHFPYEMKIENLRTDFPYDDKNGLLTAIDFGKHLEKNKEKLIEQNNAVKTIGFNSLEEAETMVELAQKIKESGQSLDSFLQQSFPAPKNNQASFPIRPVSDPERRKKRLNEQLADAPVKVYKKSERNVRATATFIDPSTFLRQLYTNENELMLCQICKEEMPFRKRDGSHYFEKKEIFSRDFLPKEHEAQYLALCPLCAAKYQELVKSENHLMVELKESILSEETCDISIVLGTEKTTIRFVESHLFDLKAILNG